MNRTARPNSLLEGRNAAPLSEKEIKRASNTFIGFDQNVNVRYESGSFTRFRVTGSCQNFCV